MTPKTIVITGASKGLGAGMALALAEGNHRLGLCSRSRPVLESSQNIHSQSSLDVGDFESMQQFMQAVHTKLGPIDMWINNAGVLGPMGPLRDANPREIQAHMNTNVVGLIYGSKLYVEHLRGTNHQGILINISSGAAKTGYFGWTSYCASKAAVDNFSVALALEEKEHLRVHSVAPGVIDTAMQEQIRSSSPEKFPMVDKFHTLKANNDFNTPAFVAQQLLELAFGAQQTADVILRLPNEKA